MKEIIDWLTGVEEGAFRLYENAACIFQDDKELADLLRQLSNDEKLHYDVMCIAQGYLLDLKALNPLIELDEESKHKIERPFLEFKRKLESGELTRKELIEYVIILEFTELNHLFLYIINALKDRSKKHFASAALNIEQHKDRIRKFLENKPEYKDFLRRISQLPKVLNEKILIVDDKGVNVNLLRAVLETEGIVDSASDGNEALKKVESGYFSAIVTDVDMPFMNGIEFYSKAIEKYPNMKDRFIFFTASNDPERITFFREHNLKYLTKPTPINIIRSTVREILINKGAH